MRKSGSVADWLAALPTGLAPSLLPADGLLAWQEASRALPAALSHHILLESPLAATDPQIDLHLAVTRRAAGHSFLGSAAAGTRVAAFVARWHDNSLWETGEIDHIWLSYDFGGSRLGQPQLYVRGDRLSRTVLAEVLYPLLPSDNARSLRGALGAIATRPTYVGLIERAPAPLQVRLIWYVPRREAFGLLKRVGWPGEREPVADWLKEIAGAESQVGLVLDMAQDPLPGLGLELMNGRRSLPWPQALAALVAAGLCSPAKHAELLAFRGFRAARAGQKISVVRWFLSHLKMSFGSGAGPTVKVYLSLKSGQLPHPATPAGSE